MRLLSRLSDRQGEASGSQSGPHEEGFLASYPQITGPYEMVVPSGYRPGSGPQEVVQIRRRYLVNIVALLQDDGSPEIPPLPSAVIRPGQVLCAYGPEKDVRGFAQEYGLTLRPPAPGLQGHHVQPLPGRHRGGGGLPPLQPHRPDHQGDSLPRDLRVSPLAVHQGNHTYYQELADLPLQSGDTLLLHGSWEKFQALQDLHQNFIIITPFEQEFHKPEKAKWATICFLVALAMMVVSSFYFQNLPYNPIPLSVCLMVGAVAWCCAR